MFSLIAPLALGGLQTLMGAFAKKGPRPSYQIPGAAQESLSNARRMAAVTTRPGNQQALDQISRRSGEAIGNINRTAGSASQALAAAGGVNQAALDATRANNAANDQFRFNAQQNLQGSLDRFAGYQREKFIKDVIEPYQERAQTKNMLVGAGLQNLFGGLNAITNYKLQSGYIDALSGSRAGMGGIDTSKANMGDFFRANPGFMDAYLLR